MRSPQLNGTRGCERSIGIGIVSSVAFVALALIAAVVLPLSAPRVAAQTGRAQLLLVVDGLRPDYVTAEVMPRLHAIGQRGMVFTAHHSVFPTVTRVNASSLATGAYPERHGLLGNIVYSEKTFPDKGINTSDYAQLEAMEKAEGQLLTAPTLNETLAAAGKTMLVISAGSSGASKLLSYPLKAGAVVNPELIRPERLQPIVLKAAGPGPAEAVPNTARNKWAVDVYLSLGLGELKSDLTAIWFGDPDETAHAKGVGTTDTKHALGLVDGEIGRLEDALRQRGLLDRTNIVVVSDHGFSTHTGELRLAALVAPFSRPMPDGTPDIVVTEGAINFRGARDQARVQAVVTALQQRPEVGAIFTRPDGPGSMHGIVPGTLSLNVARGNHPRAADILVSGNWTRNTNAAGFPGTTTQGGVAGHGTSSPFDIHNTLLAAGPDIRERSTSALPTSNVDIAQTLLRLLGMPVPATMTGRVIEEALRSRRDASVASGAPESGRGPTTAVRRDDVSARLSDGSYRVDAHISVVGESRYLDETEVVRPAR